MKSILCGLATVVCAGLTVQTWADATWTGGTGSYTTAGNWSSGAVPVSTDTVTVANGDVTFESSTKLGAGKLLMGTAAGTSPIPVFRLMNGILDCGILYVGYVQDATAAFIQSGGTLNLSEESDDFALSIGEGADTSATAVSTYTLTGGSLTMGGSSGNGANFRVGGNGNGKVLQSGGAVTMGGFLSLGRYVGGVGIYEMTGGTFVETRSDRELIIGEQGTGALTVSGTAEIKTPGSIGFGIGTLNLVTGGVIRVNYLHTRDSARNSVVNFNGGTLAAYGSTMIQDSFLSGLTSTYIKDGGANIEVGEGRQVTIAQNLLPASGSAGGLTKTGAGVLRLSGSNTYAGNTTVAEGVLAVGAASAIPGLDSGKVTVASGACLSLDATAWPVSSIQALLSGGTVFSSGASFGIDTQNGSATIDSVLPVPAGVSFYKTGANVLTLTGANTYAGATKLYGGLLCAEKGVGIPAASHITFAGGGWAPVNESPMTRSLGTGADQLSGITNSTAGFSALGAPLTVNIGGAGALLALGDNDFAEGGLILNDAEADNALTFVNPIDATGYGLNVAVNSSAAGAGVTMQGAVSATPAATKNAQSITKTGAGTVTLNGMLTMPNDSLNAYGGTFVLNNGVTNDILGFEVIHGGSLKIRNGSVIKSEDTCLIGGWSYGTADFDMDSGDITIANYLWVGAVNPAKMTVSGGTITSGGALILGNGGTTEINQSGGKLEGRTGESIIGGWDTDHRGSSTYNLSDGTLRADNNFQIGRFGRGVLRQTGGLLYCQNWLAIARYVGSSGVYDLLGGTLQIPGNGIVIGEQDSGTMTIGGTGTADVPACYFSGSGAEPKNRMGRGTLNLNEGGTLITDFIGRNTSTNGMAFNWNGGTLKIRGTGRTENSFFRNLEHVTIGPKGAILDTGDNNVYIQSGIIGGVGNGTFTKRGSGTLHLIGDLPAVSGGNTIEEGTVSLRPSPKLLTHRWSFNGDLADSVGGQTAAYEGSAAQAFTSDGKAIQLAGGAKGISCVNLGANPLPSDGKGVTIELWATQRQMQNWGRIFDFGSGESNYMLLAWTWGTESIDKDDICIKNGTAVLSDTPSVLGPYTLGQEFHICVVINPPNDDGNTIVDYYKQDAITGATLKKASYSVGTWTLSDLGQSQCYLGRSQWPDNDASANYDECRVWHTAFTEAQLTANAQLGPDVLPTFSDGDSLTDADTVLPSTPSETLLANDYLVHRWSFNGDLADSIGGQTAVYDGSAAQAFTSDGTAISLAGGAKGASCVNLGANPLPSDGSPVTIELWATQRQIQNWGRVFDIGSSTDDYFLLAWTVGGNINQDDLCIKNHLNDTWYCVGPFSLQTEFHISAVLRPVSGGTQVTIYKQDVATGRTLAKYDTTVSGWTLANLGQTQCYLGRSQWPDNDASANYNECRIWNAALSEAQLSKNALLGPDVLPILSATMKTATPNIQVDEGATLDLGGQTLSERTIAGAGTVANGAITVTDAIEPDGTLSFTASAVLTGSLKLDLGDLVSASGTLDLSGANLVINDLAALSQLRGGWIIATSASGGLVGPFKTTNLGKSGYGVLYTASEAKLIPLSTLMTLH